MLNSLIRYPTYFDTHTAFIEELEDRLTAIDLREYASQLLRKGLHDETELELALQKAVTALVAARIPAVRHFKKVFVCSGGEIKSDWLVSELGLRLIILNADVSNPAVARLQIEILTNP